MCKKREGKQEWKYRAEKLTIGELVLEGVASKGAMVGFYVKLVVLGYRSS